MEEGIKLATLYSSTPDSYKHLTERLEQAGYTILCQPIPDQFTLDPSIRKSDSMNLWQGEKNLAMFVLEEERRALNQTSR